MGGFEKMTRDCRKLCISTAAILTILGTGACGSDSDDGDSDGGFVPIKVSRHRPVSYELADKECQSQKDALHLSRGRVFSWEDDKVVTRRVPLPAAQSTSSLSGQLVRRTLYGGVFSRTCDLSKPAGKECVNDRGERKGWTQTEPVQPLRICEDPAVYGRKTYEGVGISSLYYLEKAERAYREMTGSSSNHPLDLVVLPHFVDYYKNYVENGRKKKLKTYVVDNMAYFPDSRMIVAFPPDRSEDRGREGYLWESAFVLAHEHGHHIHQVRVNDSEQDALVWQPLEHRYWDKQAYYRGAHGRSPRSQIQGSVGEAFADLLAFYSLSGDTSSLIGLSGLGYNRNVAGDDFRNGDEKILTEDRLTMLFDPPSSHRSDGPNYSNIHTIGAIMAHSLDDVFAELADKTESFDTSDGHYEAGYQLSLKWIENFEKQASELTLTATRDDALEAFATSISRTVNTWLSQFPLRGDDAPPQVKSSVCKRLSKTMPVVTRDTTLTNNLGC